MMRSLITRRSLLGLALLGLWVVAANAALPTTNLILDLRSDTGVTTSGGRVSAWTDQSPAANGDATQATSANRPFLTVDRDGYPVVRFPYGLADTGGTNPVANYLSLPSGFHVAATRAYTVLAVVKPYTQGPTNNTLLQIGTWAYPGIQSTASAGYVPFLQVGNQAYGTPRIHIPCSKVVLGGRTGASATDFLRSWKAKVSTSAVPSGDPGSGGTLGATNTPNSYWYGDIYRICVWNASLSDQDVSDAMTALTSQYSVPTSYSTLVACVGDSITLGTRTTDNQTWPFVGVPDSTLAYMAGISGYKIGTSSSDSPSMRASRSTWIDDLYDSAITNNIVLMHLGTNVTATPTGSGTAATDYGYLTGLCGEIKGAHGWTIYVDTIPQRNDSGGYSAFCAAYNPLILGFNAGTDNIDGVFDSGMNGDSPLGRLTSSANTTYFYSDSTHPNNAGTFVIASAAWARLTGSPLAPISPAAAANSSSRITVSWTDASTGETGFKIYYHVANTATWTLGATASANATSAAVTGLNAGTTYYFKVVSYNGTAESVNNGTVNATTDANAAPVAGILAPDTKTIYTYGTSITFAGAATDAEDVATPAMAWSSDRDGALGSGASVTVSTLSYGRHVITLTATDSNSQTGTATIVVFIVAATNEGSYGTIHYYVAPDGNDSNDGSTWALAKLTIGAAKTAAATAGTNKVIAVAPGWYDVESSNRVIFSTTETGKTLTFFRYSGKDGGNNDCHYSGSAAVFMSTTFNALWFNTNITSGTYKWDGISIGTPDTNQMVNIDDATLSGTLTVTLANCTLSGSIYPVGVKASQKTYRNVAFSGVRFAPIPGYGVLTSNAYATLTFSNCRMDASGATSPGDAFFSLGSAASASLGDATFTGCTLNVTGNTSAPKSLVKLYNVSTTGRLIASGSTLTNTYSTVEVQPITSSAVDVILDNNTLATDTTGSSADTFGVHIGGDTDTTTYSLGIVRVQNNLIHQKGTGSGASVIMSIGPECTGAEISYNKILGHDYWNPTLGGADGKGLGIYLRGCANVNFHHNAVWSRGALVNVMADGMKATQNTFRSDHGSSTNGATVFIRDQNISGTTDTKNVVFTHNILQAGSSTDYVFSIAPHAGGMDVSTWIVDRNAYFKTGTTSASNSLYLISGAGAFTGLSTFWAAQGGVSVSNDGSSVFADPQLTGVLTITRGSPAKGTQTSPPTYLWNDWGAFARKAGTIRRVIEDE